MCVATAAQATASAVVAIAVKRLRNFLVGKLGVSIFVLDSKLRSLDRTRMRKNLAGGRRVSRKRVGGEDDLRRMKKSASRALGAGQAGAALRPSLNSSELVLECGAGPVGAGGGGLECAARGIGDGGGVGIDAEDGEEIDV